MRQRFAAAFRDLRRGRPGSLGWLVAGRVIVAGFHTIVAVVCAVSAFAPDDARVWRFVPMAAFAFAIAFQSARRLGGERVVNSFDALRSPSRAALLLGRVLRNGVPLAILGAAVAAFVLVVTRAVPLGNGARDDSLSIRITSGDFAVPGLVLAVAGFLAPLAAALRRVAAQLRDASDEAASRNSGPVVWAVLGAAVAPLAALWIAAGRFPLGDAWVLACFLWIDVPMRARGVRDTIAQCVEVLTRVAFLVLLFAPPEVRAVIGPDVSCAAAAFAVGGVAVSIVGSVGWIRDRAALADAACPKSIATSDADAVGSAGAIASEPSPPLERIPPGRGHYTAACEYRALGDTIRGSTRGARAATWAFRAVVFLPGPAFAAAATGLAGRRSGQFAGVILAAVVAAALARRRADTDLAPRIHLLGVDWRRQVRANLRCFLVTAAPAVLAGACVGAASRGFDERSVVGIAAVAACVLLRAGWAGLTTVSSGRLTFGCGTILAATVAAPSVPVPSDLVVPVIGAIAAAGAAGIARLLLQSEADLGRWMRD